MKTGIHFKDVRGNKLLNIHPETLLMYLQLLPKNEAGWITFRFEELEQVNDRGTFAALTPLPARNKA